MEVIPTMDQLISTALHDEFWVSTCFTLINEPGYLPGFKSQPNILPVGKSLARQINFVCQFVVSLKWDKAVDLTELS